MIGWLRGSVIAEEPPHVTLEVRGVGYEVAIPTGTLGRASLNQSGSEGQVGLWVHTVLRTDVLELFGFASELERRVFRVLLSVPNVGPRTALGVLSALPVKELVRAIQAANLSVLTKIPGVGKKTAERLVLELRGKLPEEQFADLPEASAKQSPATGQDAKARLTTALTNMGYRPAEADRAVLALGPRVGTEPLSELLRDALALLS